MRFVAGRGAAAERLAGALQRRAIGKMLLAVDTVTELLLAGAPWWLSCCWPGDATEQDAAGRGAVTELLLAGALLQNSIGKQPAGQPAQKTRQRKGAAQNSSRRKRVAGSEQHRTAANAEQQAAH